MTHNTPEPGAILRAVSAGYARHTVLHEVTAEIPGGAVTAVVGANGSGKSTVLGVLAGIVRPAEGAVRLPRDTRPALVVQQNAVPALLPITVRETVTMGRWAIRGPWRRLRGHDRQVIESCLARLGISDLADHRLSELSGGQRQRALLAQALAQQTSLLLLDEPTASLDAPTRESISRAIDHARKAGTTVVHATHDLDEALSADHCLLLRHGRILSQGPPRNVLTAETLRRAWGAPVLP
ncbi:zinc ABC transporter ATP-binding protein AztA [Prauserella muralis]|uniref:ABC transporter n=1 Tax=Prauserella muralis TaxID=588067 RepID=A0A2V4ARU2_9PSEU|nr:zinc ABC transporter ATP-binding protein AztA [Prauserella muralis]PXY22744.1 ABC transporter [Prauserella muralis]TWE28473.1 zinc/manganese transport system ATP-binding protein [Prauserella muralis]